MKVLYCTGNEGKFKEASFVFEEFNKRGGTVVEIAQVDADPTEVQGTAEEIGLSKVNEAVRILSARGAIPEGGVLASNEYQKKKKVEKVGHPTN